MGPTGVGKTDLAVELYSKIPMNIISVDSVQIYKDLNIGSGKPSQEILEEYPHKLIDYIEPMDSYSTARFQSDVIACIKDSFESNKIPVLVGGTMMYFHHLVNGISKLPSVKYEIRLEVEKEFNGQEFELRDLSGNRTLVVFDNGDEVAVQAGEKGIRFLLISGTPIKEPVAWHGPIVMNTQDELKAAFNELNNGTFIK